MYVICLFIIIHIGLNENQKKQMGQCLEAYILTYVLIIKATTSKSFFPQNL